MLRLYDEIESQRSHGTDGSVAVLLVLDEAEARLVDATMAIVDEECTEAARWGRLPEIYRQATTALTAVPHTRVASAHLSHSYGDGACLYFTFAATPPPDEVESTYVALWDAGTRAVLAAGGNLSHHHGVGLNRARFVPDALGPSFQVLTAVKQALDPNGILNPGKLGLLTPFGALPWP